MLYTLKRAGGTGISCRARVLPSLVSCLETRMLLLGLGQLFCVPQGTLWVRLVQVGEYPKPSLEVAGVRSAPELQQIPCHCWSLVPWRSTDRKLRESLARAMVKPQLLQGCGLCQSNAGELNFHRILDWFFHGLWLLYTYNKVPLEKAAKRNPDSPF